MSRINLLPWREERRKEQQKQFLISLGAVIVGAVLVVYLCNTFLESSIANQRARNKFLSTNIHQLDDRLAKLAEAKNERQKILDQTTAIRQLQGNRPLVPRVLDQLARLLPEGVYFTSLSMDQGVITITGVAPSNSRISSLLRQLNDSPWFEEPNLVDVQAHTKGLPSGSVTFKMTAEQPGLVAEIKASQAAARAAKHRRRK